MERTEILLFNINVSSPYPHLGIASLAAYLKERGVNVLQRSFTFPLIKTMKNFSPLSEENRVLFREAGAYLAGEKTLVQLSEDQINDVKILTFWAQVICQENPVCLGVSVTMANVLLSLLLCRIVKKNSPEIKIILGGPECNATTKAFFLREGYANVVIEGEGEVPLYETLCCIREQRPIKAPGATLLADNKLVSFPTPLQPLDINTLPTPDFGKAFMDGNPPVALSVGFNRGCSFRCAFCDERLFWKTFRQMNVAKAVATLEQLQKTYGINRFFLSQSLLNNDLSWLEAFASLLREKNIGALWGGNARTHREMDKKYLECLYQGGCRFLYWGIESGSRSVLKSMKKGTTPEMNKKVLLDAASNGIWNHTYWIFGFPTETEHDLLETIDFILENNEMIHSCFFHIYNCYSELSASKEKPDHNLLNHYQYLEAVVTSQRSPLVTEFLNFFSQIAHFMAIRQKSYKKFDGHYPPLAVPEEKKEMLTAILLLRYFIVEPCNRKEIAHLFEPKRFRKIYQEFSAQKRLVMESFTGKENDIGIQLFHLLKKSR